MAVRAKMAAMVGNDVLPEDVMLSVLSRLPVKTLKRFSCVCKSWFATFENPDFIRNHYITNKITGSNRNIIVQSWNYELYDYYLSSEPTMKVREIIDLSSSIGNLAPRRMVGECQGLICLFDCFPSNSVALLNPATRQVKLLPQTSTYIVTSFFFYALGLGFDYKTKDYKVVMITKTLNCRESYVQLYYLSTNSWKRIHFSSQLEELRRIRGGFNVYFNGCCHWLVNGTKTIIAFDMSQEVFQSMPLPAHLLKTTSLHCLRVFDGYLSLFVRPDNIRDCFEIHVMKEYGVTESWTLQMVLGPILELGNILRLWRSGDHWFVSTYDTDTSRYHMKLYDTSTNVVKDLGSHYSDFPEAVIFTENLLSLTGR